MAAGRRGRARVSYALQLVLRLAPSRPAAPATRPTRWQRRSPGSAFGGGALLFAGTLAAHGDAWWPGLLGGLPPSALAQRGGRPVIVPALARACADRSAREALTRLPRRRARCWLAGLVALLHPLGYVALALLAWLLVRAPRARGEKYAGPAHPAPLMARREPAPARSSSSA